MTLTIRAFKYCRSTIEVNIPKNVSFFEPLEGRSLKVTPKYTNYNKRLYNKDEEIEELQFICIYTSDECKIERFNINICDIENIFLSTSHKHNFIISFLICGLFYKITEIEFNKNLQHTLSLLNKS